MDDFCGCSLSTLPGKELICAESNAHQGPHHAHGVTWTKLKVEMADDPPVCKCGHPEANHPLIRTICTTCGYIRRSDGRNVPNGVCMGWWPPGSKTAQVELVDADPADLHQAIHAANAAIVEGVKQMHMTNAGMDLGRIAVESAAPVLLADLEQVENERDHAQNVAQATRDRHADLQVYCAELVDLLDRARMFMPWPTPEAPKLTRLHTEIVAVLQGDGATKGRTILDEVGRLRDELRWANDLLDTYGAPSTIYNPYERVERPLNLAGRISRLIDPQNKGFDAGDQAAPPGDAP